MKASVNLQVRQWCPSFISTDRFYHFTVWALWRCQRVSVWEAEPAHLVPNTGPGFYLLENWWKE